MAVVYNLSLYPHVASCGGRPGVDAMARVLRECGVGHRQILNSMSPSVSVATSVARQIILLTWVRIPLPAVNFFCLDSDFPLLISLDVDNVF